MSQPLQEHREKNRQKKKKPNRQLNSYAKYTGMAFQMLVIILIAVYGGIELDKKRGGEFPLFTVVLSLIGVFAALYTSLKDFIR